MNRLALLIALAVATLGGGLWWLYKQRFEAEVRGGPPVAVLVVRRDVPLGAAITDTDLAVRQIPSAWVEARQVRATELSSVIGVRTANQLRSNESLLWTDLAAPSTFQRNLSGLVRTGTRAVSVSLERSGDFAGLLRPGDRIDLIVIVNSRTREQRTFTIAQAVLVLAVGADLGGAADVAGERQRDMGRIALALTPEEASIVTHARGLGELTASLRNPDDVAKVDLAASQRELAAATAALAGGASDAQLANLIGSLDQLAGATLEVAGKGKGKGKGDAAAMQDDLEATLRAIERLGNEAAPVPPGLPPPREVSP